MEESHAKLWESHAQLQESHAQLKDVLSTTMWAVIGVCPISI